jgi:hypothetical protein
MSKPRFLNPALKDLEIFIGNWDMEITNADFLPTAQTKVHGPASFRWIEGGAYLISYQGSKPAPQSKLLISRDDKTGQYKALYFDSRGVSRVYEMSLKNKVWKLWRNVPGFPQRFKGIFKDRNTIVAEWKTAKDGKHLKHDFDIKYTRII